LAAHAAVLLVLREPPDADCSQIVALAGFDPMPLQFGASAHGRVRSDNRGDREVRKRLLETARSAARYDLCARSIQHRLQQQSKPKELAPDRSHKRAATGRPRHLQKRRVASPHEREGGSTFDTASAVCDSLPPSRHGQESICWGVG
jgi:hypothetical protein